MTKQSNGTVETNLLRLTMSMTSVYKQIRRFSLQQTSSTYNNILQFLPHVLLRYPMYSTDQLKVKRRAGKS